MSILAAVCFAVAAGGLLMAAANLRYFPKIAPAPGHAPATTACVAVRNEEAHVEACIVTLFAQPEIESVVVADDGSTDRTTEILRRLAANNSRLFIAQMTSPGNSGKTAALAAAADHAQRRPSQLLFFTDADVRLARGAIGGLYREMRAREADAVSAWPAVEAHSIWDALLAPLIPLLLLQALPMWMRAPDERFAAGNGQLFLIDREAYRRSGGHAAIATVVEDVALAKSLARNGSRVALASAANVARVRGYGSLRANVAGLGRSLYCGSGVAGCIAFAAWQLLGFVLAWFALPSAPQIALGAILTSFAARLLVAQRMGESRGASIAAPIAALCSAVAALAVGAAGSRGALTWRGRVVS